MRMVVVDCGLQLQKASLEFTKAAYVYVERRTKAKARVTL
jgi:hypothetical protein